MTKGKWHLHHYQLTNFKAPLLAGQPLLRITILPPHKVVISDSDGKIGTSSVSNIEVGYLAGTNDSIQNQLDSKQNNLSNVAGTGEVLLESDSLKRIYGKSNKRWNCQCKRRS